MLKRLLLAAIAAIAIGSPIAHSQSSNPFNPDFAFCATQGAIAVRNGTTWGCLTPGTSGQVLRTNGPGANVSWQTVTGAGTVTSVGLTLPSIFTVTGSPVTTAGTLTGSLASQMANRIFAAPNGSAGAPTFRAMVAADMPSAGVASGGNVTGTWPSLSISAAATGGVITGTYPAITVGSGQITNAMLTGSIALTKLATQADSTIVSNISGVTAAPSANTITSVLDKQFGTTHGAIVYRGASAWQALAPSSGGILQSNGSGNNPSWVAPSAAIPASVGIGHRLTLSSNTPVMSSTVSAATSIISTPYTSGLLLLWNGSNFVPTNCAEFSQTLADTTKSPAAAVANSTYDVFAWNDGGTCRLSRGPVWTNNTTRSAGTALSRANSGILSNSVAITNGPAAAFGTYMGTIKTDVGGATVSFIPATTSATCSPANNGIWNYYNRMPFNAELRTTRSTYAYSGATRVAANDTNCAINYVAGASEDGIFVSQSQQTVGAAVGNVAGISIGVNSTSSASSAWSRVGAAASASNPQVANLTGIAALGHTVYYPLEATNLTTSNFSASDNWSFSLQARY
jgi:hypothetical protein